MTLKQRIQKCKTSPQIQKILQFIANNSINNGWRVFSLLKCTKRYDLVLVQFPLRNGKPLPVALELGLLPTSHWSPAWGTQGPNVSASAKTFGCCFPSWTSSDVEYIPRHKHTHAHLWLPWVPAHPLCRTDPLAWILSPLTCTTVHLFSCYTSLNFVSKWHTLRSPQAHSHLVWERYRYLFPHIWQQACCTGCDLCSQTSHWCWAPHSPHLPTIFLGMPTSPVSVSVAKALTHTSTWHNRPGVPIPLIWLQLLACSSLTSIPPVAGI